MLWKITSYKKLPAWAKVPDMSKKGLYILVRYPWPCASSYKLTPKNFVRAMIEIHKQCKSHR